MFFLSLVQHFLAIIPIPSGSEESFWDVKTRGRLKLNTAPGFPNAQGFVMMN
jgi:hypothetical protein